MRLEPDREISQTGQTVGDFWVWAYSDVDTNIMRAVYAEWLVGTALGCVGGIRPSWTPWDLDYDGARVEVKSTSYMPNWGRRVDGPRPHNLARREHPESRLTKSRTFDIKATGATLPADSAVPLGPDADYYEESEIKRRANIYIFAYYAERDPERYSSLDVGGWRFYVLPTPELERHFGEQERVALSRVQAVTEEAEYGDLKAKVDAILGRGDPGDS